MNVFDIEADGLEPTKIHCLVYERGEERIALTDYDDMREWLGRAKVLVGHNIIRFDIPVLERLLGIEIKAMLVDTLALSWYLYPHLLKHGLGEWGEHYGIPKPKIDDWENLTLEEYVHRCTEDVSINKMLWDDCWKFLLKLYGSEKAAWKLIKYLAFKMDCAREQERSKWKVDIGKAQNLLDQLLEEREEKQEKLAQAMPKVPVTAVKKRPAKLFKLNGEPTVVGKNWFDLLEAEGLPPSTTAPVTVITGYKEPKPSSHVQVKAWLDSLGWVPETFEYKRNKETGDVRKIPQVSLKEGKGLCPSVKKLYAKEPNLELMDGLSIIIHRISILEGFINNSDADGYVKAEIGGLTNTLRFKHRVVVNLPGVDKAYGKEIRGCLTAPDGYELCGSDMSSLEDRTKQHYMWPHDPEYVMEMIKPDFDPHLDLAVLAKAISEENATLHKLGKADFSHIRKPYKATNYAAVYGSGATTLARTAGVTVPKAAELLEVYWQRNWSVKVIAEEAKVKVCNKSKWLYNPVSRLWYSLRHEKDRFSTLNQGTGVYCFDTWVRHVRSRRPQLTAQFHDEIILCIKKGSRDKATQLLKWAINKTNEELKLNRELDISIDFGEDYSQIH